MSGFPVPVAIAGVCTLALTLAALVLRLVDGHRLRQRRCVRCGCTDLHACPGGCSWVSLAPPLCSRCA